MKATHDSGSYYLVKDKKKLNLKECKKRLCAHWNQDYYSFYREWQYKGIKPRIIVEPLLNDGKGEYLTDYKFYTFNGEPKVLYITSNRGSRGGVKENFFDLQGNELDIVQDGYRNTGTAPKLPNNMQTMIDVARILAKDTYHLRVDFYEIDNKVLCGELTLMEGAGLCDFAPEHWNRDFGDWIKLPTDKN